LDDPVRLKVAANSGHRFALKHLRVLATLSPATQQAIICTVRDDFTVATKQTLAKRVGMRCSNPGCPKPTSGPQMDPNKSINVGFAAHITAAAEGGCRYDPSLTTEQRQDIKNGIWLCGTCPKLIDSDEARYTVEVLRKWKRLAEENALADIESGHSIRDRVSDEDNEWAGKFSDAIGHLSNIIPRFFMGTPGPVGVGRPAGNAYGLVFPELKLRQRIETFLIHLESANKMQARPVTAAELRLQVVRDTIQAVLDRVDHVQKNDNELATRVHLT
jgi:hypothetical protein